MQTFSWISLCRWTPQDSRAVNKVSRYCWTLQMAEARAVTTAVRPTFSMTFWKADGEWRVILHRACGDRGWACQALQGQQPDLCSVEGTYLAPSSLFLA